jgi:hypothetical protein
VLCVSCDDFAAFASLAFGHLIGVYLAQLVLAHRTALRVGATGEDGGLSVAIPHLAGRVVPARPKLDGFT